MSIYTTSDNMNLIVLSLSKKIQNYQIMTCWLQIIVIYCDVLPSYVTRKYILQKVCHLSDFIDVPPAHFT